MYGKQGKPQAGTKVKAKELQEDADWENWYHDKKGWVLVATRGGNYHNRFRSSEHMPKVNWFSVHAKTRAFNRYLKAVWEPHQHEVVEFLLLAMLGCLTGSFMVFFAPASAGIYWQKFYKEALGGITCVGGAAIIVIMLKCMSKISQEYEAVIEQAVIATVRDV